MAVTFFDYPLMVCYSPLSSGGRYQVVGTTSNKNLTSPSAPPIPVRRRVRLHQQVTGFPIREVWSESASGAYIFDKIAAGTYYVTGFDHTGQYGGVIETDIVVPTPLPAP